MPKIADPLMLSLAEEVIRYGVSAARAGVSEAADELLAISGGDTISPMSMKAAAAWLSANGYPSSRSTLRRNLGTTAEIRAGQVFADTGALRGRGPIDEPVPSAVGAPASAALPAGFRNLELDDGRAPAPAVEDPAEPAPAGSPNPAPAEGPTPAPDLSSFRWPVDDEPRPRRRMPMGDDDAQPDTGDLLPRLLPNADPVDRAEEVLYTLAELRLICSAVYVSAVDVTTAALYAGLNPFKLRRVLRQGLSDLSRERESGEVEVVLAVSGHWAASMERNGRNITRSATRGDVRAQKLLTELLGANAPDLDSVSGGSRSALMGFARQVRAFAMAQDLEEEAQAVGVNAG